MFPSIPLVARSPSKDAVHNGYYISENTIVVLNLWAMLHDETVWSDSEEFKPDRWLAADAADKPDPLEIAFGFNRLASTFDISPERGSDEDSIIPSGEYADGGITYPPPFTCEINPRSQHAYDLIITAMAEL
ncbi:hypothetical protein A0H81_02976 [Grifola frondosa]|uniref:Uncharacterized protein n=1 Tax=Grifola frondosa TaxID=5627 RepID=A0A1C7MH20_GRIFR|nr:hypothetical protein A0H81_02976 [Grifola frondosa]